jgi:two-component system, OmpR family, response regulator
MVKFSGLELPLSEVPDTLPILKHKTYNDQMKELLLIDDDEKLAPPLKKYLGQFDFDLYSVTHPLKALELLRENQYELIILDVMLPEIDGFETCRRIRQFSNTPVLMLTARGDVMDRVVGLEIGADDYLAKPFEPRELVARIKNILKRTVTVQSSSELSFEGLKIDTQTQQVVMNEEIVELTSNEYRLLLLLAQQPQKVFSRDDIMSELNGIEADIFSRAIDIQISRLRQKLNPIQAIKTIRARGYQFVLPVIASR